MTSDVDEAPKEISEVTRRAVIDHFSIAKVSWAGRLQDDEFLARLYDLSNLPSFDYRYQDAAGDIYQHCVCNSDWESDWVFYDRRFNLMYGPDAEFLRFLCETVHPVVRPADDEVSTLVRVYNEALTRGAETPRVERIARACEKKFPKLARWKQSEAARTVLVFEDNDVQLTNVSIVAEAFLPIATARADAPDETYMVSTCTSPWYAWPVLVDGRSYFDLAAISHPIHFEMDASGRLLTPAA